MARRLPLVAALAGLVVIAAVLGVVLARDRVPVTGGNNEFPGAAHFGVAPGQEACQPDEVVPSGTLAVRLHAAASGAPGRLRLELRAGERLVASGERRWDGTPEDLDFRLDPPVTRETPVEVCVRNTGPAPTALWSYGRPASVAYTDAGPTGYRVRTRYLGAGPAPAAQAAGGVATRMAAARGGLVEGWAPWGALAAALGLVAVVLVAVRRGLAP